ncbi:MAG: HAMP domain-containing sensor histidine kinase [Minisyncoccia bacterium]
MFDFLFGKNSKNTSSADCQGKMSEKELFDFISVSAHQLKTPLSSIKWSLETLQNGSIKNDEEKNDLYKKMYEISVHAIHLVDEMLSAYKLETKSIAFDFEPGDNIADILNQEIEEVRPSAEKKNITLDVKLYGGVPTGLYIDHSKIQDVFQNLLENAIRYTKDSGKIYISYIFDNKTAEFMISDTGIGIPAESQSKIFTKFFRAPGSEKMENRGNGLGLFISKSIVEAHGGKIWFESEAGKGTTFFVSLPMGEKKNK